jgi:GxxExxY protein
VEENATSVAALLLTRAASRLQNASSVDDAELQALNRLSERIIGAAIEIHSALGPGLLESVYRECMIYELRASGLSVTAERSVSICYKQLKLEGGYRLDLLVENQIIVELKSVEKVLPVHLAQLLSYLRLTNKRLGLLINFNVPRLVQGVSRRING